MVVKKLGASDWAAYRAIRLEALSLHEGVYGGSYQSEADQADHVWKDMLADVRHAFFGLYDQATLVGIGAVFTDRSDERGRTALLAAGYISEAYRGRGYSRLLYDARIAWARSERRFERILVGHKENNEASRRANQAFGFTHIGTEGKQWGDGSTGVIHHYELRLS